MIETVHGWDENPIYCHKLRKVLVIGDEHLQTQCTVCPYFHGSMQGQGTECWYYDGTNEPQVVNTNPNKLEMRMRKISDEVVQSMVDSRLSRAKMANLTSTIKALGNMTKFKITREGQHVALVAFGQELTIDVKSKDEPFLAQIKRMIVSPVELENQFFAPGTPEYPIAVVCRLLDLGYDVKPLN